MKERVNELKKSFLGKDCLIITAGPSLKNACKKKLKKLAKGKVVIAVKQAIYFMPEIVDIHVINDNNYDIYNYENSKDSIKVILLKSNSLLSFTPECTAFLEYKINEKTCDWKSCIAKSNNFKINESLYKYKRNWGPGIMYELCIYFPILFNSTKVFFVAWDLGYQNCSIINRFYEKDNFIKKLRNYIFRISPLFYNKIFVKIENLTRIILYYLGFKVTLGIPGITLNEASIIADSSYYLSKYYSINGITKYIVSDTSMLHESFKRI